MLLQSDIGNPPVLAFMWTPPRGNSTAGKPGKTRPTHRFSDESRWCAPKGAVSLVSPREVRAFPSKILKWYLNHWWMSLCLERLFSEDTHMVSKLRCMNLLSVSSYLLSTGVFMSLWEVYRSVITYGSQIISPGEFPLYISKLHRVTMHCKLYICAGQNWASLPPCWWEWFLPQMFLK